MTDVNEAIKKFNRIHEPEVRAELVEIGKNYFVVKFSGRILCYSCGLYDYFEDLIWLSDLNAEVEGYEEREDGFYVRYSISTGRRL
ncbi:hypothetical protein [Archaeoglobus sp.]